MLSALTLAAVVLAAPVPKDARPAGPAPRMVDLVPDSDGKVKVDAIRADKRKVQRVVQVPKEEKVKVVVDGKEVEQTRMVLESVTKESEVSVLTNVRVELGDVRDLKIYTADGKEADRAMALKKLTDGGVVVVAEDGQKVDPKYLKLLRDDVLVLVSPELARPMYLQRDNPAAGVQAEAPRLLGPPGVLPAAVPAALPPGDVLPPAPPPLPPAPGKTNDAKAAAPAVPPPLPPPPDEKKGDEKKEQKKD